MQNVHKCPLCDKELSKKQIGRNRKYCSRACYTHDRNINIEINPNWKHGNGITNYGCQVTYRKKNRHKRNARDRVGYAIKTGKLRRAPCGKCGNKNSEAHHTDYGKPLEVQWLCKKCHAKEHYN